MTSTSTPAVITDPERATQPRVAVLWRGEPIPLADLPARIAAVEGRAARDALFAAYREALRHLDAAHLERLDAMRADAATAEAASAASALAKGVEGLVLHTETPYFAALRRYLALIDIEQGDATEADLWHIARGAAWDRWFGPREVRRAVTAVGRAADGDAGGPGWLGAERWLAGPTDDRGPASGAARAAYASVAGSPEWLGQDLGVHAAEIPALVDFIAFVRLWRLRRDIGRLQYELRLFAGDEEPAALRAYYAGILGHLTGVEVAEEAYLVDVPAPFASARAVEEAILGGQLVASLEARFGARWWTDPEAAELVAEVAGRESVADALAHLGYDALDWSPVLRQIRTRLIGEMSGYGGPNITTRAGTRKV